jgi:glycerol kinase
VWLCIDQGGHSTRAAVFDADGAVVSAASAPVSTQSASSGWIEHDADELLGSVRSCIESSVAQLGTEKATLRGVAVATQRSTIACVTRSGQALRPLISWQDRRGGDDLHRFEGSVETIRRVTGLRLSPHYGIGKLRWCLRHDDRVARSLARGDLIVAPLASYLAHALCENRPWVVDPVNASRMLLMDLRSAQWSETLLQLFDVPAEALPSICPNRCHFGMVSVGDVRMPLTVLTGDQAAAVYAFGEPEPGTAFINIGTGAFIQVATGATPVADDRLLSSVIWQDEDGIRYVLEGTVNGAATAIDTVAGALDIVVDPGSPELAHALARIEHAPLYLNGVSGLGSPDWVPEFTSRFVGDGSALECLAAAYESIAFLVQRNIDRLTRRLPITRARVTGGMARLDWLVQRIADLSGLVVERSDNTEATLGGLAHLASDGLIVDRTTPRAFRPRANAIADRRYRDWTRALTAAIAAESRDSRPQSMRDA